MTASKSSRARNARIGAQASAARNSGGSARNGSSARNGTAVKNGTRARPTATRDGAPVRAQRTPVVEDDRTEAGPGPAPWLQITTLLLALAGLGVSIYLTIAHFDQSSLAGCSEKGFVNCTKVTTSAQSYVFGIPVAVLGMAFYVFVVAIMSPWAWRAARREVHLIRMAAMVAGMGFVLYLLYAELITIGSICLYCTSVHAIMFVLFVLTAGAAAIWGFTPGRAWKLPRLKLPRRASAS